jgi:hypothetical protein
MSVRPSVAGDKGQLMLACRHTDDTVVEAATVQTRFAELP